VLVSGASGIVGYGILRSLRKSGKALKLVSTTIYEDSVAQGFSDIFEKAPLTTESGYMEWLLRVIRKHEIDLIIPAIEADMYAWVDQIPEIQKAGASAVLNDIGLIALCKDKWNFYESLKAHHSPYTIESSLSSDFAGLVSRFGLPFLLKPRRGFGSKGIVIVDGLQTFLKFQPEVGNTLMVQQIVGDINEEFTTSAFCDGNGGYYCHMTLKRKLSRDGFTEKAEVVSPDGIEEALTALCGYYKPVGPTNFQFRRQHGVLKLLEINPRISSSTSIRAAFGYNESLMAVEYYLESRKPVQPLIKQGKAVRYVEDFITYL
jgi:carbamoyl-phosphate synthase large subunit